MTNRHQIIKKMCIAMSLVAIGFILPFITGNIKEIGNMLCPMHLPVLIGGFILGPYYGAVIGFILPIFRSLTIGMPPFFPTAISMSIELLAYGAVSGLMFKVFRQKLKLNLLVSLYVSLIIAMLVGRALWGLTRVFLVVFDHNPFTFKMFLAGAFINAWPGIIVQLILVPLIVFALIKTNLISDIWNPQNETRTNNQESPSN
ncbi:MAG: ECF transporter S component [Bacilli bacterium]|nr:ECF transporter S component [Bacilli bacterium]MDD7315259.1 ECF transporter S component [Bacilli bacterium]